jgi:prophage regulatory protein
MTRDKIGDRIVSAKERRTLVPYSDMHIWRLEQSGKFPRRIRLGANRVGWSLNEVQAWIEAKKNARVSVSEPRTGAENDAAA